MRPSRTVYSSLLAMPLALLVLTACGQAGTGETAAAPSASAVSAAAIQTDPVIEPWGYPLTAFDGETNPGDDFYQYANGCLLYTSPSPRDQRGSRMPSSA